MTTKPTQNDQKAGAAPRKTKGKRPFVDPSVTVLSAAAVLMGATLSEAQGADPVVRVVDGQVLSNGQAELVLSDGRVVQVPTESFQLSNGQIVVDRAFADAAGFVLSGTEKVVLLE